MKRRKVAENLLAIAVGFAAIAAAVWLVPRKPPSALDLSLLLGLYVATGLGITVGSIACWRIALSSPRGR